MDRRQNHLLEVSAAGFFREGDESSPAATSPTRSDGNTITMVPIQKLGTASIRIENERVR